MTKLDPEDDHSITPSCGNVLEDIGLPNPEEYLARARVVAASEAMLSAGLPQPFVEAAVHNASWNSGIADLMTLWLEETDAQERDEIVTDIANLVLDAEQVGIRFRPVPREIREARLRELGFEK